MLDPARALLRGIPTKIADAVNATGNNQSRPFSAVRGPFGPSNIRLQAAGTFTVLNGNVEFSLNGGTNWSIYQAFDFVTTPLGTIPAAAGALYKLTFNTVTQTVPPDILAVLE